MKGRPHKRVLVTGACGMLGSQLLLVAPEGVTAVGTDIRAPTAASLKWGAPPVAAVGWDLSDHQAVRELWQEHGPFDAVIHAAAYTAVDRAEQEPELARRVNAGAAGAVAVACAEAGAALILLGTDFVFDGSLDRPYRETDPTRPLGVYGRTKLEGEEAARAAHAEGLVILRTQWLYGARGVHFPGTILGLAAKQKRLQVVSDQIGSPTSTLELAPAVWDVLHRGEAGIYHAACEGSCSWYELARETLRLAGITDVEVVACGSEDFPRPALRPANGVLDASRLAALRGRPLAHWREALAAFLAAEASGRP